MLTATLRRDHATLDEYHDGGLGVFSSIEDGWKEKHMYDKLLIYSH